MGDPQVALLREDRQAWNELVAEAPGWKPSLLRESFEGADLRDANLRSCCDIGADAFAGADMEGAQLPEDYQWDLTSITEASKNARNLFIAMLAGCFYCWLTVFSTTDLALAINTVKSKLPIIAVDIDLWNFYVAAPFLLTGVYVYTHLYLGQLWRLLASLPARFPDGRPRHRVVFPWLLNGYASDLDRKHHLERAQTTIGKFFTATLTWAAVPITLAAMWTRFLPRHDTWITLFQVGFLTFTVWWGHNMWQALRQKITRTPTSQSLHEIPVLLVALLLTLIGLEISHGQVPYVEHSSMFSDTLKGKRPKYMWPKIRQWLITSGALSLEEAELSQDKPREVWTASEGQLNQIKGANLRGRNLRNIRATNAFLARADLRGCDLTGAYLGSAELTETRLEGATLQRAELSRVTLTKGQLHEAKLEGANLWLAKLERAILWEAKLEGANLMEAKLEGAILWEAKLEGANLRGAELEGAKLWLAKLEGANLWDAKLEGANLSSAKLEGAILYQAKLEGANLWDAKLEGANLRGAELEGADLRGASLNDADLEGADLRDSRLNGVDLSLTRGLSVAQIKEACLSDTTALPIEILAGADRLTFQQAPDHGILRWLAWNRLPDAVIDGSENDIYYFLSEADRIQVEKQAQNLGFLDPSWGIILEIWQ